MRIGDPSQNRGPRGLCDFELNECPTSHGLTVADVAHLQLHEIACAKLAVDCQIEKSKFPAPPRHLQSHTDRPDLFEFKWGLLAYELALIPRFRE